MTDLLPEIKNRKSPIIFTDKPVGSEKLTAILEAARWAPSSFNHQPWRYLVITESDALKKAHHGLVAGNFWAKEATALIIVVSKRSLDDHVDGKDYYLYDTGLSVMSLVIEAMHQGLAAHQMLGFKEDILKKEFGMGDEWRVVVVIAVGYAGDIESYKGNIIAKFGMELFQKVRDRIASPRSRKKLEEIASFNEFGFDT